MSAGGRQARAQEATTASPPAADMCAAEDSDGMRMSLNYMDTSPYGAERDCRNCHLWSVSEAETQCGSCTLIEGAISPFAYCDSWAAPDAAAASPGQGGR